MIEQTIERVKALAERLYKVDLSGLEFRVDMKGLAMGSAQTLDDGRSIIRLSIEGCSKYLKDMCEDTIPHEIAHIVCNLTHGYGHDHRWSEVCKTLGGLGETCHNNKLTPACRLFSYRTTSGEISELTIIRHNKLQKGKVDWYRDDKGYYLKDNLIGEVK